MARNPVKKIYMRMTKDFALLLIVKMALPRVFFDVSIGGKAAGRIIFQLYADVVPKTVRNSSRAFALPVDGAVVRSARHVTHRLSSLLLRRLRTFARCALARRALATQVRHFIG